MKLIKISLIFNLIIFTLSVFSQSYISKKEEFSKSNLIDRSKLGLGTNSVGSILDPSKFDMQQSYSVSYMTNGKNSDMTALYLNSMSYKISTPLTLKLDIGIFHKPMNIASDANFQNIKDNTFAVPRIGLIYQPSDDFFMSIEYIQNSQNYSYPFLGPFGTNRRVPFNNQ